MYYWKFVFKYLIDQEPINRLYKTEIGKRVGYCNLPRGMVCHNTHPDVNHKFTELEKRLLEEFG